MPHAGPQPVEVVARGVSAMQPERERVLQKLARIADAATADHVLVSDVLLAQLEPGEAAGAA